ncbi:hypothetical protein [Palaeococcus ferrophilus]|uniref:hypothetical protein n=1 Tax=Palaeococcus ferrophilus TaxID=83868 RepID=UPI00064F6FBE|nr:hypothetical protein [Palaeococcus ferrophilus]
MGRGQLSLDILFAMLLVMLTITNIVYLSTSEVAHAETLDSLAKVKTFSITVRDHAAKVYAVGEGFRKKVTLPFTIASGDSVTVTFNSTGNRIVINASIGGKGYSIVQNSTVPLMDSSVTLDDSKRDFWMVANVTGGELYVKIEP